LDAQSNALHAQKLVKVVHAERQVREGCMRWDWSAFYSTDSKYISRLFLNSLFPA
jgi:hypothetical protein